MTFAKRLVLLSALLAPSVCGVRSFGKGGTLDTVEEAARVVDEGPLCVGLCCRDGVVLLAARAVAGRSMWIENEEDALNGKLHPLARRLCLLTAGRASDGQSLAALARKVVTEAAGQNAFDFPEDDESGESALDTSDVDGDMHAMLVKELATHLHEAGMGKGSRPYSATCLLASAARQEPRLIVVDAWGHARAYRSFACGVHHAEFLESIAEKNTLEMDVDEALQVAFEALNSIPGGEKDAKDSEQADEKESTSSNTQETRLALQVAIVRPKMTRDSR